MDLAELLADVSDLLRIGAEEWLAESAAEGRRTRARAEARAVRIARLHAAKSRKERLAEIDARIDLLMVTPGVADVPVLIGRLRALRERVARRTTDRRQR